MPLPNVLGSSSSESRGVDEGVYDMSLWCLSAIVRDSWHVWKMEGVVEEFDRNVMRFW